MPRYIDVDKLREEWLGCLGEYTANEILNSIDDQPTADVVPVVRCEDCTEWERTWTTKAEDDVSHYCPCVDHYTIPDWFCADGERRK